MLSRVRITLAAYQEQIVDRRRIVVVQALLLEVLAHLDYLSLLISNRLPQILDLGELETNKPRRAQQQWSGAYVELAQPNSAWHCIGAHVRSGACALECDLAAAVGWGRGGVCACE